MNELIFVGALVIVSATTAACADDVSVPEEDATGSGTAASSSSQGGAGGAPHSGGGGMGGVAGSASTGPVNCDNTGCSECHDCAADDECAVEFDDCVAAIGCAEILLCHGLCGGNNPPCEKDCVAEHPRAESVFSELIGCLGAQCTMTCGSGGG